MSKPQITYFDTGPLPISFAATRSQKAFEREMKRLNCKFEFPEQSSYASTYTFGTAGGILVVVTLNRRVHKSALASVCAHSAIEAMHDLADASEETWAYITQWATQCLYEEFKR